MQIRARPRVPATARESIPNPRPPSSLARLAAAAAAWTLCEWLRGWLLSGFGWLAVGYAQLNAPLAGYAFYYRNQPNFLHTNLTLRLAVAPTYLDSELGFSHLLGEHTDLGVGIAGGERCRAAT